MAKKKSRSFSPQRYIFTGVVTVIPIWITWIVFEFIFRQLSNIGTPWVKSLAKMIGSPDLVSWISAPVIQSLFAIIVTVVALYLLGYFATLVIGKRLLRSFELIISRIPYVQKVYRSIKKLVEALQQKPESLERVVLIEFPSPHMKTVGFVTQVMKDQKTGKELAAVYVPTTPNPTSGYLEIVPIENLISTDWTIDEAMTFIISGGTVGPKEVHYEK